MHRYCRLFLFKLQQQVIILWPELPLLQLSHDALVVWILLRCVIPRCRFPVPVWRRPQQEFVLRVILNLETQFADLRLRTNNTLILRVIYYASLAANTLKRSIALYAVLCCCNNVANSHLFFL